MPEKRTLLTLILLATTALYTGALCWSGLHPSVPPVTILTVDPVPQQTLKGWGIYPCTYQIERPHAERYNIFNRPNAQRLILGELGESFIRCNIYPNSYDSKKDDGSLDLKYLDSTLVRQLRMAARYGQRKYLLTVWSPPEAFKEPRSHLGTDPKTGRATVLRGDREADYCRYVVRVLDYLTKVKMLAAPIAYSVQNEPGFAPRIWDGTAYDSVQWRRVTAKMRRVFDERGYKNVELIGPECGNYRLSAEFLGGESAPALKQDPRFDATLSGFAYHGYDPESNLAPFLEQLRSVALEAQSRGKDVWLTEWSVTIPMEPLEHTLTVAQRLGREMTYIPTNYWAWWQGWYYQHPKSEVLITGEDDNHLHISKTYNFLKALWHLAPAGSVVYQVTSNDAQIRGYDAVAVQTVAFKTGERMTLMVVNPSRRPKKLRVEGASTRSIRHYLTADNQDMALQAVSDSEIRLPGRSVSLLVWAD